MKSGEGKVGIETVALEQIRNILSRYPVMERAILYGSRAKGMARLYSDIDIALLGNVTHSDWASILNDLDDLLLPYKIDLSLYKNIRSKELREHIQRVGIVIFQRDTQ